MDIISYKEFMEKVKVYLNRLSIEDFQNLILNWASEEHPSNRQVFLAKLVPQNKAEKEIVCDGKILMGDIEAFERKVENGEYCEGWGWDEDIYEERDWGDESWADEMDDFFLQARSLVMNSEYKLAEKVYRKLFDILEMGQEPGHLPGDPDCVNMLEIDMNEQVALFLRAAYMNVTSEERTGLLYDLMNTYGHLVGKIKLKNIIDSTDAELPEFDAFIVKWIEFLNAKCQTNVSDLLREAVFIKGGIQAISEFAKQYPDKYPLAYIDWITALEMEDNTEEVIRVAREGLSQIPRDYIVRAEVAETISRVAEKLNDNQLKLEGYRECFYSNPCMKHLLNLYSIAIECDCFEAIQCEVEQRNTELQGKKITYINNHYSREQNTASVSKEVLFNSLLLAGKYERAFEICKGEESLGWSNRTNSKPVFIIFMMTVLSNVGKGVCLKVLDKQWDEVIESVISSADIEYVKKYKKIIEGVKATIELNGKQEEFYLKWCTDEIGKRVDAIVSHQYRKSYYKAAELLISLAETFVSRGKKQQGVDLIEKYKGKYPRHTAFKSEIVRALKMSENL